MMTIITGTQSRSTKHLEGVTFECAHCGQVKQVQTSGGTGYAVRPGDDKIICYQCCGEIDRKAMIEDGKATLYLLHETGAHQGEVTNWPCTLRFKCGVRKGSHNIARTRYDVWFTGPDGFLWHGTTYGDNTQICHCKRTKERAQ